MFFVNLNEVQSFDLLLKHAINLPVYTMVWIIELSKYLNFDLGILDNVHVFSNIHCQQFILIYALQSNSCVELIFQPLKSKACIWIHVRRR